MPGRGRTEDRRSPISAGRQRVRPRPAPRWCSTRSTRRSFTWPARSARPTPFAPGGGRGSRWTRSRRGSASSVFAMFAARIALSCRQSARPRTNLRREHDARRPPGLASRYLSRRDSADAVRHRAERRAAELRQPGDQSAAGHAGAAQGGLRAQGDDLFAGRDRRHRRATARGVTATAANGRRIRLPPSDLRDRLRTARLRAAPRPQDHLDLGHRDGRGSRAACGRSNAPSGRRRTRISICGPRRTAGSSAAARTRSSPTKKNATRCSARKTKTLAAQARPPDPRRRHHRRFCLDRLVRIERHRPAADRPGAGHAELLGGAGLRRQRHDLCADRRRRHLRGADRPARRRCRPLRFLIVGYSRRLRHARGTDEAKPASRRIA